MDKRLNDISEEDRSEVGIYLTFLTRIQKETADKLHISEKEFVEVLNGQRSVKRVIFYSESRKERVSLSIKRLAIAAMMIILLCCFVFEGFADTVRGSVINAFTGQRATRIDAITYDKSLKLSGLVLPSKLPHGYEYRTHTHPQGTDVFNVVYSNENGNLILYYYYPSGTSASIDNEQTKNHAVPLNDDIMQVNIDDTAHTTVYFPYQDTAFIQIEFDAPIGDDELRAIAGSLKRQP